MVLCCNVYLSRHVRTQLSKLFECRQGGTGLCVFEGHQYFLLSQQNPKIKTIR